MTGEFDGLSLHRLRQRLSTYRARDQAWNTRLWHLPAISEITKTAILTRRNGTLFWRAQTRAAAYAKLRSMTGGLVPKERHADRLLVLPKARRLTRRA